MNNAITHLGAPAAAVAIATLVSAAAVLGARYGVPQGCASMGLQVQSTARPLAVQSSLDQTASDTAAHGAIEQRIAFARHRLALTPEQVPHWEAFAGALRDRASVLDGVAEKPAATIEPVGQHVHPRPIPIDIEKADAAVRAASHKQFAAAWAAFYDGLTDEQKETAASLLIRHDGR